MPSPSSSFPQKPDRDDENEDVKKEEEEGRLASEADLCHRSSPPTTDNTTLLPPPIVANIPWFAPLASGTVSINPYANSTYVPPPYQQHLTPIVPQVVTMDDLAIGFDPQHQIIVLQMASADSATFPYLPIMQLNVYGAIQLIQMLRVQIKRIELLPPLRGDDDLSK
jgi:hypothetical protein